MTAVGQPYRPSGPLDLRSIGTTAILGAAVAALGAGLIWLWEISPIPTLVIFTPLIQAVIVGFAMAFMVERLHLRSPRTVGLVGFLCGLLSIGLVHYGHHLHLVSVYAASLREAIVESPEAEADKKALMERLDAHPAEMVDEYVLVPKTGHGGFLGTMILRNEIGVTIKRHKTSGAILWALWGFEALLVAGVSGLVAASTAAEPYCEDCGLWCEDRDDVLAVKGTHADALAEAVLANDVARVAELRAEPMGSPDASGQASVKLHSCGSCGQTYATVAHNVPKGRETKTKKLLNALSVSPEMVAAMTAEPDIPLISEGMTGPPA